MPETGDGIQGLPQKPIPCKLGAQASRLHSPWERERLAQLQPCAPSRGRRHLARMQPWERGRLAQSQMYARLAQAQPLGARASPSHAAIRPITTAQGITSSTAP